MQSKNSTATITAITILVRSVTTTTGTNIIANTDVTASLAVNHDARVMITYYHHLSEY